MNLKEPDFSGHTGNWQEYTEGVKKSDYYVYQLWNFIQEHPKYKNYYLIDKLEKAQRRIE